MLAHNAGLTASHPYASGPINWPFLLIGISFWTNNDTKQQIYMIGNMVSWWTCVLAMSVITGIFLADALARRRGEVPIPESEHECFCYLSLVFCTANIPPKLPIYQSCAIACTTLPDSSSLLGHSTISHSTSCPDSYSFITTFQHTLHQLASLVESFIFSSPNRSTIPFRCPVAISLTNRRPKRRLLPSGSYPQASSFSPSSLCTCI